MSLPRFALSLFICMPSAMVALLAPACLAQLPVVDSTTATPIPGAGHDYLGGLNETVNPVSGSISIRIPVILPPSRGITVPFSFTYDSGGVNFVALPTLRSGFLQWFTTGLDTQVLGKGLTQAGWSNSVPMFSDNLINWTTTDDSGQKNIPCAAVVNFVYQDANGNRHNLNLTNYSDPGGTGPCTYNNQNWPSGFEGQVVTVGGEGSISASLASDWASANNGSVSVTDGDGNSYGGLGLSNRIWPAGGVSDRNGNYLSINSTSYPAFNYVDTLGRTVLQDTGFAVSPETLTVSGLPAPYIINWTTLATPSFSTGITIISGTQCGSPAHFPWTSVNNHAVSSIQLPNGQSFTFTYDPVYGLVNKMTYPTGGYVRYVWGMNPRAAEGHYLTTNGQTYYTCDMSYDVPAVTDRYVSFDGTHEVEHRNFQYTTTWPSGSTTWTTKQTTVTTYDLIRNTSYQTIYKYGSVTNPYQPNADSGQQSQIPVESSIVYYDTNGAQLETVSKQWENQRLLVAQQTSFPGSQTSLSVHCYDLNEEPIETDDYDFGSASPALPSCVYPGTGTGFVSGSLLQRTVTTYAPSTTMASYHVIDKPSKVQVYDSTGTNLVGETDYTYDSPLGSGTSGIVSHSGSCNCGNVTAQSRWLNTSGTTLNTTFTNDDTGQRLSMTDPRGNTTTYSYADSYSSGSPSGPTNAYLTQITLPQTNGVSHIEKFAYAYASGEVTSSTDQNNLVTSYKYNDPGNFARLTETDFPDGGSTTVSYNDSPYNPSTPSPSVTTSKKINSGSSLITVAAIDGLGHPVRAEVTSDPQGIVYTDTAYDGLGRVYTVSNPYRSGTDPTTSPGTTTYIYDGLGRKCVEVPPDGTAVSGNACPASAPAKDLFTQYSGSTTTVTDQTGKKRQSTTDGLARLIQVVEDPGGLGYATNYTLDTLGNLKQIVQNGSHTRTFTYDSLSRLLCSSNPENSFAPCPTTATTTYTPGTVGYTYDANSNVATKSVSTSHGSGTSGSGSSTSGGSEQSLAGAPAVSGTGSVTFSGNLQSKQVVSQPATHATGSVLIAGSEQSGNFCDDTGRHCHFLYDNGSVTITVNGGAYTVSYGEYDTSNTIASNLATALSSGSVVTATASGSTVYLTSVATGTSANYSLSASSFTDNSTDFSVSFVPNPSGSSLTGGLNVVYTTRYDSGTSTITVNGHADTVSWSGSGTTTSSIASSLASTINADSGAYVSASASGATVNLTAKTVGVSTDYSLSSSYTYDTTDFSSSSFTSSNSGAALTGGRDPGATIYDTGSVWITLNGTQYSVSYGQGSSTSSLASTLASAINAGSLATASANGSGITITASAIGVATNYSLSSGSSTSQPGSFSSPSFSVSVSGGSMTGGTDPGTPIVTSYLHDALNREYLRTYSNGDPTVSTTYDQSNCLALSACQNIGHATSVTDAAGSESWAYQIDQSNLRSAHANLRTTSNITYPSTYYFDLAGNLTRITYPTTGRVVNYTYDAANRPATAVDSANGITYAAAQVSPPTGCLTTGVCYTPQGTEYSSTIGKTTTFNGVNLSETYNSRLQPLEIKASSSGGNAFDIIYSFVDPTSSGNAGHVNSITNNLDTTRSQTFSYDSLNRITGALTTSTYSTSPSHCWGETYGLDAWGNLNSIAVTTNSSYTGCSEESGFSTTADGNNHLPIFGYDLSGNTQSDGTIAYTYDAESQIKTAAGVTYLYDGSGRRVSKSTGKLYWYGSGGEILAETTAAGATLNEYIFFAGKRVAMLPAGGNAEYYAEDFLGSSRVTTTNNGTVCYDADFYPYGGERAYTNSCPSANVYKFEGKERDTETGNDDFGARYYSNRFGRWLSADWSSTPVPVPYANLTNPQTLNLYSMVADDPESFADLDGHELVSLGQHTDDEIKKRRQEIKEELKNKDLTKEQKAALKKEGNTLNLEQEGNHVVGQMLANLDKTGERNGLTLKNFTLTTDTNHDFPDATRAQVKQFLKDEAFAGSGTTIYLRTETGTVYDKAQTNQDWSFFGSSMLRHEQVHVGGFGETMAYQAQIFVFGKFKSYFQNSTLFGELDAILKQRLEDEAKK